MKTLLMTLASILFASGLAFSGNFADRVTELFQYPAEVAETLETLLEEHNSTDIQIANKYLIDYNSKRAVMLIGNPNGDPGIFIVIIHSADTGCAQKLQVGTVDDIIYEWERDSTKNPCELAGDIDGPIYPEDTVIG